VQGRRRKIFRRREANEKKQKKTKNSKTDQKIAILSLREGGGGKNRKKTEK